MLRFVLGFCILTSVTDAQPPNIVLIYTDDQGVGDVSALNPEAKFQTPHLDRLVREGMSFTDGHSPDTVCTPSRYALLTGRYSWRTRLKKGVMGAEGPCLIEKGETTLASLLGAHGYQTAMVGKWHLGMVFPGEKGDRDWSQPFTDGPIEKGFDYFWGIPASMNYGVLTYLENDRMLAPANLWTAKKPGLVVHDKSSYRITPPYGNEPKASKLGGPLEVAADFVDDEVLTKFTEKSVAWMKEAAKSEKPFFIYIPLTSPHKPVCATKEFIGKSECGAYGDFMMETDHHVGQLLGVLDELKIAENTMVIFTADNGAENTYKDRIEVYGHRSGGIYRGGKRDLYEGGHRVPFLVRWPAAIAAGSTCDEPVCQTDFLATFAEMLDVDLPEGAGRDSESILKLLKGEEMERGPLVHHSARGEFGIRDGKWKLNLLSKRKDELFDLKADPGESNNLIDAHPEVARQLLKLLEEIHGD